MKILNKRGFKLPYVGRERFLELRRIGLGYEQGLFFIRDLSRAEEIKEVLSEVLREKIGFQQICVICKNEFACLHCKYYDSCPSKDLPLQCICENCRNKNDLYREYVKKGQMKTRT